MLAGVNLLADAVKVTLGPRGRNVALPQKANLYGADYGDTPAADAPVLITNDGVTIAKSINLPDPFENMGAQLCKEAAVTANDAAGDGTTTAIVLAQAILQGAFRQVAAGADPLALRRGIQKVAEAAAAELQSAAVNVESQEDLSHVAAISCQDEALGALIGEALSRVGAEGVVNVDDSRRLETTLDIQEGIVFDRGLLSPHMATDVSRGIAELRNPYILLTDKKLTNRQELIPTLMCAAEDDRDCLIICDGIEGDAMTLVLGNNRAGDLNTACVMAPEYGEGRRWRMDDLAVQTGGVFITTEAGYSLNDVTREMLGSAQKVTVAARQTTIEGAGGDPQAIADRISQLRYYVANTDYEFNQKRHAERLAKFVSGVATIHVGGATETDQWERKMRVEDAVHAARAAFEDGVVAGGGVALFDASRKLESLADSVQGDERAGVRIALDACKAPLRQIAENAGVDGAYAVAHVAELEPGTGYDALHDAYADMLGEGVFDPLRVTLGALNAAFSVAGTALLTEAGVTKASDDGAEQ